MKNRQSKIRRRQAQQAWLSILPALLLILVMCAYPIVQTVIKSFTDWNGIGAAVSVGFKNYINILSSGQFWSLLCNNLIFLLFIPFQILIGVIVAVLIYDGIPGGKIFRVIYYIPQVISAVIVGYLFKVLFSYDGAVNSVLKALHLIREAIPWLERSGTARTAVIISRATSAGSACWPSAVSAPFRPLFMKRQGWTARATGHSFSVSRSRCLGGQWNTPASPPSCGPLRAFSRISIP